MSSSPGVMQPVSVFKPSHAPYADHPRCPPSRRFRRLTLPRRAAIEQEKLDTHAGDSDAKFSDCFRGSNTRRTWIAFFSSITPNFWGLPLRARASYFMQIIGQTANNSILFLIVGIVVGLAANIFSPWRVAYFRRRTLMLVTFGAASACWISAGISGSFPGEPVVWFTTAMLMFIIFVCGTGAWPVASIVAAETSSLRLRGKTLGLSWIVNCLSARVFSIAIPYLYNPDAGNLGGKTGYLFAGLSLTGTIITWFIVPEMKGCNAAEIDEMFEQGLPARESRHWVSSDGPPPKEADD